MSSPYRAVLEDLEWLRNDWWLSPPDDLSEAELRRASAALRLLLVEGLLQRTWRDFGFARQPLLSGPDLHGWADHERLRLEMAISIVVGGGRQNGIDLAFIGAFRVDHPTTGVPADAPAGFAVKTCFMARDATQPSTPSPLDQYVAREWPVSNYLDAPGAVRRGTIISRKEVIEYFRSYVGGAHHDLLKGARHRTSARFELIAELEGKVHADIRSGLYFELLSIGQSVGRSADVVRLIEAIKSGG